MFDPVAFNNLMQSKPEAGVYLTPKDGEPVAVKVEMKTDRGDGPKRLMIVYAAIDPECSGWFVSENEHGVACLLVESAKEELMRRYGDGPFFVTDLYVVRQNFRGTALICDLADDTTDYQGEEIIDG